MNPGPLEIIGNPLTPEWVKQALKSAVQQDTLDGIYWANVILMALRREANERAIDEAHGYYERERLKASATCRHQYQEDSTVCTICGS